MEQVRQNYDEGVDIDKFFRLVLKRRGFLLTFFLICVICVGIVNLLLPRVYEISMIIEPPVISITNLGVQNFDTVDNIRWKIESGAFDRKIIDGLKINNKILEFKISSPKNTRLMKISLAQAQNDIAKGIDIMNKLADLLKSGYSTFINDKKNEFDNKIAIISKQIVKNENQIKFKEKQLQLATDREKQLNDEVDLVKLNQEKLLFGRESFALNKNNANDISGLLYTTMIQQGISYLNQLQNELSNIKVSKESYLNEIENLHNNNNEINLSIKNIDITKNSLQNISIVQEPLVSLLPIAPNRKKNILFTGILSLMVGVFIILFMESQSTNKVN